VQCHLQAIVHGEGKFVFGAEHTECIIAKEKVKFVFEQICHYCNFCFTCGRKGPGRPFAAKQRGGPCQSSEQLPWMLVFKKAMSLGTHVPSPLSIAFAGRVGFLGGLDGVAATLGGLDKLRASLISVLGRSFETSPVISTVENLFIKCDRNDQVYQYGVVVFVSLAAMTAFLESLQAGETVWRRFRVQSNTFCTITAHWSFPHIHVRVEMRIRFVY